MHRSYLQYYFGLLLTFSIQSTYAWQTLTNELDIHCAQQAFSQLNCDYRTLTNETFTSIKATLDKEELTTIERDSAFKTGLTAILLLVDTSDPQRQNVIDKNIAQIEKILAAGESHHLFGLGVFDKQLRILAPMGASNGQILEASSTLRACGMTTELYRNLLEVIEVLKMVAADRKAIYIFSDGQAEDKAYFHSDVVAAARKSRVVINSLGYPRSVALSVALQTLRRLSDETGGQFIESNEKFELPSSFLSKPFRNIDDSNKLIVDLESIDFSNVIKPEIRLHFKNSFDEVTVNIPISIPLIRPKTIIERQIVEKQAIPAAQPIEPADTKTQTKSPPEGLDLWLWYGVPIALIVLIVLTLFTLFLLYKKPVAKSESQPSKQEEFRPYAYLVTQDEKGLRYPIIRTIWRIGRSRDNEMTLNDHSISRRHAEIQRDSNGQFILLDTNSSNGLFVNDEKISKHILQEGDIIEIGDISLRFTQRPIDYQLNDETAMLSTKLPA